MRAGLDLRMDRASLQLQGGGDGELIAVLLAALVVVLLLNAAWQLAVRRRVRAGLLSLAAAMGPLAALPALLIDWRLRRRRGDATGARTSLLASAGLLAMLIGGVALYGATRSAGAAWMVLTAWWVVLAVTVFYAGVYASLSTGRLTALLVLRCLAVAMLVSLLFKPAISIPPPQAGQKPFLPILADRSGSMATADYTGVPNRYTQAVQSLLSQSERINAHFTPAWRHFATSVQTVSGPDELAGLKPAGAGTDSTNIAAGLRQVAGDYRQGELAGILLLSDGVHTTADSVPEAVTEAGVPIYTIGLGLSQAALPGRVNARVLGLDAPLEAIKDNRCTIAVRLHATGLANRPLRVRLMQGEAELTAETVAPANQDSTDTVKLGFIPGDDNAPPNAPDNIRRLRVRITPAEGETLTADNDADVHIVVAQPRIRVLYIESIRPEYGALNRQLRRDPNVQLVTLVHLSASQFVVNGQIGGITLNGLPSSSEELNLFDVVILGDIDSSFWTKEQLRLLADFVRAGKGLLMLGGHSTFGPGGYGDSPLQDVLPVVCGPREIGQEDTPFVPQLTADGQASSLLADTQDFLLGPGGQQAKLAVPELTGCVKTAGLKPGASALAIHPTRKDDAGPLIVLASQQAGKGRAVAFTADTTWRWQLEMEGRKLQSPYARFWQQMMRYLANVKIKEKAASAGIVGRTERSFLEAGQSLPLLARVQDTDGATSDAAVSLMLVPADRPNEPGKPIAMEPTASSGIFEGTISPPDSGTYTLKFSAVSKAGQPLGADELPLVVASQNIETDRLARDEANLQAIATRSHGLYADIRGLPDVIDRIIDRSRGLSDAPRSPEIRPLYSFPIGFLLFVGLVTVEWSLRRKWQLQ